MRKLVEQLKQEKQELFSRLEEVETHLGSTDEWARETTEENTKLKIENAELKAAMNKLKAQGLLGYGQGPE
jgi:septal ring factor EnvC (AmiA/AmiB activator)